MMFLHGSLCLRIAVGRFYFITPMYWTLQNLTDSEKKLYIALKINV
jgi:hypothetical protein